ncbi:MAG: BlaI/MecI/CopY family transcriptional regulator [Thermogutta sp.]|uniref:BlaI/MecI/CopY family transcriptional regulator n=1 Tax=Thermogutta sp. TaxID=1962930 RepID=UPI00199D3CCC|nr:BlaI/MecI/CopY family transcriptional regulator [Thermogutta sp.]MBC7352209.1 BlaI/MecI/CopY family transcriptional regulator [Thermogutta sp.]
MAQKKFRLGDLQLRILRVLWDKQAASVQEVHEALEGRRLAYTTVATMLRKMEQRGLVGHRLEQRRFIYFPRISQSQVVRSATADFLDRLFQGSLSAAVCHLLETRDLTREELEELERLIAQRKREMEGGCDGTSSENQAD